MDLSFHSLKQRHRDIRDGMEQSVSLRVHRALSWLNRSEKEQEDEDARFIFLWIAFNAAYAQELGNTEGFSERRAQQEFFGQLVACDRQRLLYQLVWKEFPNAIRVLLENPYIFPTFWEWQQDKVSEDYWRSRFQVSKQAMGRALAKSDTETTLAILFERLYVLRNQIVHGGSTWQGRVNRSQVKDCAKILSRLVPLIIHLVMENADLDWGTPLYPVVDIS